jgi:exonuclease VII small subunit
MSKSPKFPVAVKCGSTSVTIYRNKPKNGYSSFLVRYYRGSEEVRVTRANFEAARKEAESAARSLANGELDVLTLSSDDRISYIRAVQALEPTGIDLETVAKQFAEAHQLLNGQPVLDAVQFYIERQPKSGTKTVAEVATELLQQKREMGRCAAYIKDMRLRLKRFSDSFRCNIASVVPQHIEEYLLKLKVSGRTQNNHRRLIGTLFRFAVKRGYLPKDHSLVTGVELATEVPSDVEIFTPEEITALLASASSEIIPFLVLGAFAGLRHAELQRLDWSDIHLTDGHVMPKLEFVGSYQSTKTSNFGSHPMSNTPALWRPTRTCLSNYCGWPKVPE